MNCTSATKNSWALDICEKFCFFQFPTAFEFNTPFLIDLLDELYSCRFGTFLYNSEKQRLCDQRVKEKTVSLWSFVQANRRRYQNPLYNQGTQADVLLPSCSLRTIKLWTDYYLRFNPAVSSHERM
uniref:Myotubularin phosphatase domain-containing protein n=1 Tax=Plectus sambesii TaxID=2011161 RepID=A0A914VH87_9BILA